MADVTKIPGPVPIDPRHRADESVKPGSDKFQKAMKLRESDPRQKKQNKEKREEAEESQAQLRSGAVAAEKSAQGAEQLERSRKIQKVGGSEKRQPQQQKRREETAPIENKPVQAPKPHTKVQPFELADGIAPPQKQLPSPEPFDSEELSPEEELSQKSAQAISETKAQEEAADIKDAFKDIAKKRSAEKKGSAANIPPAASPLGPLFIAPPSQTAPGYTMLKPEMLNLFETMISHIFIMQTNGVSETTFHVDTPQFAGMQITIREYSTAPLVFNIEFLGSAATAILLEQNIASLREAFASEKRNFTINRIESHVKTEARPHARVTRKKKSSEG